MENHIVDARGLILHRGGREVLHDVSCSVRPGEIIGLIGRNGAGKSTLMETLLGFHAPQSGEVRLWGEPVRSIDATTKRRIGFVPQQDELVEGLTVWQQVELIASFYPQWDHESTARLLETWELPRSRPVTELSLGQRQRLSIILAIGQKPELLVLDEPVASLDPLARAQFLAELTRFVADGRNSLIFSSHIVSDLEALITTVWIMDSGNLRWQGRLDDIGDAVPGGMQGASLHDVFMQVVD